MSICRKNAFPSNSRYSFLQRHSTHEEIRESARVNYWVGSHNPARTSSGLMFELWISDGFEWFFVVKFLYPKFAVHPRSKQLMPVTVKFRLNFLVCGLQGHLLWHLATVGPMCPCNKGHEARKNCRDWVFSHTGLEARLPAFQLPMFEKCDALANRDLLDMLVKGNPCLLWNLDLHSLPEAWGPWERQHTPPALQYACIMRAKDRVVVSKIVISAVLYSDCCKSTKNCTVEIQLLATVGWKRGCQAFSCRCSQNVTHCRKEIYATCWFVGGIHSTNSFWVFQASTPYQKLEVPESGSTLHQFCIMLASCPSLRCSWRKKTVSCRDAEGLVTELWSPRFVTYNTLIVSKILITGYWLCSQLWHVTATKTNEP